MPTRLDHETRERYAMQLVTREGYKEQIDDRAACGGWPLPQTAGEYLAWIIDEAEIQIDGATSTGEIEYLDYASSLFNLAGRLLGIGVIPTGLPWDK